MPTNSLIGFLGAAFLLLSGSAPPDQIVHQTIGQPALFDAAAYDLRDGDLVFRQGRGLTSQLILQASASASFSHVGVIIMIDKAPFVVHALPEENGEKNGVVIHSLARFASPSEAAQIAVRRVATLGSEERGLIRQYVMSQVGRPFDDSFVHSDDAEIYCTELAIKALEEAGLDSINASVPPVTLPLLEEPVFTPNALSQWDALIDPRPKETGADRPYQVTSAR